MPKYIVELKETRTFKVPVTARDKDAAYEIASGIYETDSTSDMFDSVERHAVYLASEVKP